MGNQASRGVSLRPGSCVMIVWLVPLFVDTIVGCGREDSTKSNRKKFAECILAPPSPERRPPVRQHCPVLRRNSRVGDRRSARGCPRWWQCQEATRCRMVNKSALLFGRLHLIMPVGFQVE